MKILLAGIILSASPLWAQVAGDCRVIDCPSNFMPKLDPANTAARPKVEKALAAVEAAEVRERLAAKDVADRLVDIRAKLVKSKREGSYGLIPDWLAERLVTPETVSKAALSDRDYLLKQEILRTSIAENYNAHNAAIIAAIEVYQLTPPVTDFTGDPRAAEINMVARPWFPRYSRNEKRDKETGQWRKRNENELREESNKNSAFGSGPAGAVTTGDGMIKIWDQAFSSPEELAILIFHETSHWLDVAAKSGGHIYSDPPAVSFRTEQRAYERAEAFARQLGADPTRHRNLAAQFKLQADISERERLTKAQITANPKRFGAWLGTDWKGQLAVGPAEPELSPSDEALLQKQMAQAQKNVKEAREYQELMEAHRRAVEAMPAPADLHPDGPNGFPLDRAKANPAVPESGGLPPLRPGRPALWPTLLKDIAASACAAPPRPVDRELAAMDWRVLRTEPDADRVADGSSACERRVVLRLIELGRAWRPGSVIDAAAVRAAAAEPGAGTGPVGGAVPPSPNHDPVWGKIPIIRR